MWIITSPGVSSMMLPFVHEEGHQSSGCVLRKPRKLTIYSYLTHKSPYTLSTSFCAVGGTSIDQPEECQGTIS